MMQISLEHATNANCISLSLKKGDLVNAWHTYLAMASNTKNPPQKEELIRLLTQIDDEAVSKHKLEPFQSDDTPTEMTEDHLTFGTTNALENALSYFVDRAPQKEVYILDLHAQRTLRLYELFGEPTSGIKIARGINRHPNLCAVHIPHPLGPLSPA